MSPKASRQNINKLIGVLLCAFVVAACSDTAGSQAGGDDEVDLTATGDRRVADITDAEIEAICEDVESVSGVQCGTDPETGEPSYIDDSPSAQDCRDALERRRARESCVPIADLVDWWQATPCERDQRDVSVPACPEYEACWSYSVEECVTDGAEYCVTVDGLRYDSERNCTIHEPAYCMPDGAGCNGMIVSMESPDGVCWDITADCGKPDGWTLRDESLCIPEDSQPEMCPESQPDPPEQPACESESCGEPCQSEVECDGDIPMSCTPVGAEEGKICAAAWPGCGGGGASTSQDHCQWNINCNFGVDYELDCTLDGDMYQCDCIVDGETTHQFSTETSTCPPITHKQYDRINEHCEWKMFGRD